jgi:acyl dehydratase
MTSTSPADVWTFDDFEPGAELGRVSVALDDARIANWSAIYGTPVAPDRVPAGMLVAAMMEAYLKAFQPRPPGNIHAGQTLAFGASARPGDRLEAQVTCRDKLFRKERRWVTFGVTLRNGAQDVLSGEIRTIWAK